jgi:hypothetical protein
MVGPVASGLGRGGGGLGGAIEEREQIRATHDAIHAPSPGPDRHKTCDFPLEEKTGYSWGSRF